MSELDARHQESLTCGGMPVSRIAAPARAFAPRPLALTALAAVALVAAPVALAAKPKTRALSASGTLLQTAKPDRFKAVQGGTIRGTPFGTARMVLRSTLNQARVSSTFTVTTSAGRVTGTATARLTLDGDTATYKGTARITGGTGRYRNATATNITFRGVGPVSAKSTRITLSGRVRY